LEGSVDSLRGFIKRHVLWAGFIAAFLPLLALLGLQYSWLVKLEAASAQAGDAYLQNYMEGVFGKVLYFYKGTAERALNVSAGYLNEHDRKKIAYHFRKKHVEGASRLFVMDYTERKDRLWYYDSASISMLPARNQGDIRSVEVACAPFQNRARNGTNLETIRLVVDENDPENYMILQPITDQDFQVVGVAGMVINMDYFRTRLLPDLIRDTLDTYFREDPKLKPIVKVIDPLDEIAYESDWLPEVTPGVSRYFPWVFTHYKLVVQTGAETPEQWARSNFIVNLSLSGLLGLVLMAGITLAFRTVSREMKLSEMKGDFVSNVSHELRTPLASIRMFGELMRLGRVENEEKCMGYGEYIETESRRLTQLLNNILDFSKIESGGREYNFQVCDLQEMLEKVLKTFEVRFKHDKFTLKYDPPEIDLPPVRLDPQAISQTIHNLLDNAMKYSGESREVEVGLDATARRVNLWVQDRGIGITRSEQKKIFERFHRVPTGAVHDVKGSGLGLAIVHHVVSAHGGMVKVRSEIGKGSRFTIQLPVIDGGPLPSTGVS
jgi:signal transduction histidine kinase